MRRSHATIALTARAQRRYRAVSMTFSLRIPRRFLRGGVGRLVLTILALACGVALVCALDLVNRAVLLGFVEIIDGMAGRATLEETSEEPISEPTASRDLQRLVEAGLLTPRGEKRGRYYVGAPIILLARQAIIDSRNPRDDSDPFG